MLTIDHNVAIEKNANFFAENLRKKHKIVIITSTPDLTVLYAHSVDSMYADGDCFSREISVALYRVARFFKVPMYMIPKPEKMYQMNTKCTKWSYYLPNVRKLFQMALKYINILQSKAL
jgi:hypothetical protein